MRSTLITNLLPAEVAVVEFHDEIPKEMFHEAEREQSQSWSKARISEFGSGRRCAREALFQLGVSDFPVLVARDRCPIWPEGVIGSISHTEGHCGAAVAWKHQFRSVGIDVERIGGIERYLWGGIYTENEIRYLKSLSEQEIKIKSTVIFSAKEAFYKLQYPLTGNWVDFHDVEILVSRMDFIVTAKNKIPDLTEKFLPIQGNYSTLDQHVACALSLI